MARGTLPLKVRLPGCEPIRRLSGTHDPVMRRKLVRMIHALHEQGRDDVVNAIARGRLTPLAVYSRWRVERLDDLPHADELPTFAETWPRWLRGLDCSDFHRASCEGYCRRLEALIPVGGSLAAVVPALERFRDQHRAHPRTVNMCRSAVLALLRDTLGRRHRLWQAAKDVAELKERAVLVRRPLTAEGLRALVARLPAACGAQAWAMATTGMGWREYSGRWEREGEGLRIHGTKTGHRDRLIPLVGPLARPTTTIFAFRYHLTAAGVTPYDLRRTFAGLMVEANIPRPRRRAYMGHTADDMTALYEAQEVRDYLLKDAARLRAVLGEPPTMDSGLRLVRGS